MASETPHTEAASGVEGPVVFAYDGSELADYAIAQAGRQLAPGQDCLVLCVWQTSDVGFVPVGDRKLHALAPEEVRAAAKETAAHGVMLAEQAGFRAQGLEVEAAPSWKGIVDVAEERGASLIVLGSHQRSGLVGHLVGSVAASTVSHTCISVLVIHRRD
jgi:nucleotide-binding universal stress UspA family protein